VCYLQFPVDPDNILRGSAESNSNSATSQWQKTYKGAFLITLCPRQFLQEPPVILHQLGHEWLFSLCTKSHGVEERKSCTLRWCVREIALKNFWRNACVKL
jgi:hypothetical protein